MQTKSLRAERDYLAPDGSEIRLLLDLQAKEGGLAHCVLHPGQVSTAQRHKTVGESGTSCKGLGRCDASARARSKRKKPSTCTPAGA
jgi:hypothetical protein